MEKFTRHSGIAAPLLQASVDTDAIIPSREMKRVSRQGLGDGLFAGWRYLAQERREPNPDFVLNHPDYQGASILLSGPNFGCGSSREHAVWALKEFGIRAIIAPGFGGIFASNCVRNGLLPLVLAEDTIARMAGWVVLSPRRNKVLIDLPARQVSAAGQVYAFTLEQGAARMLEQGLDPVALTLTRWDSISAFHKQRQRRYPWLYRG